MIIKLRKGKYFEIINQIKEYDMLIEYKIMSFEKISNFDKKVSYLLKITSKYTKIKVLDKEYLINKRLAKTDLYTIINAVISMAISDENNAFVHSVVVSKKGKGILLLGTFGQGKTAISLEMEKNNFEINSADQTYLFIKKNKIFMRLGSRYLKYGNEIRFLEKEKITSEIEIKKIIFLVGICEGGIYKRAIIKDKNHLIKKIFPFLNWWTHSPLITNPQIFLENPKGLEMFRFLKKLTLINKNIFILRGDKEKISLEINNLLEKGKINK
jgi:hypothetical protein